MVVALVTDLIFATKIRSTADALGVPVTIVKDLNSLKLRAMSGATRIIIDMSADGADPIACIRELAIGGANRPQILAFLSHVQTALSAAAREAGADQVMARSEFSKRLPEILTAAGSTTPRE